MSDETPPPSEPPAEPVAGWYPDPYDSSQQRYWDGSIWTGHTAPGQRQGVFPQAQQGPPAAHSSPPQPMAHVGGQSLDTWLWQSIVVTFLCCLPLGIVGIINASQASTALAVGDHATAVHKADLAKKFSLAALGIGLLFIVGWFFLVMLGTVAGF